MRAAPLVLLLLLCGCARTRQLAPAQARAEANRRAEGRTVSVALRSGERVEVRAFRIDTDSASWLGPGSPRVRSVAASDVAAVTHHDVTRGAADGFWIGLATGLASTAVAVLAPGGRSQGWDPWVNGVLVASGGLAGAGWGALGGTLATAPVTVRLDRDGVLPGEASRP